MKTDHPLDIVSIGYRLSKKRHQLANNHRGPDGVKLAVLVVHLVAAPVSPVMKEDRDALPELRELSIEETPREPDGKRMPKKLMDPEE